MTRICRRCQRQNSLDANFCGGCGDKLNRSQECCICLTETTDLTTCGHPVCTSCLRNDLLRKCPICRFNLITTPQVSNSNISRPHSARTIELIPQQQVCVHLMVDCGLYFNRCTLCGLQRPKENCCLHRWEYVGANDLIHCPICGKYDTGH